jgi:hypothetical protein
MFHIRILQFKYSISMLQTVNEINITINMWIHRLAITHYAVGHRSAFVGWLWSKLCSTKYFNCVCWQFLLINVTLVLCLVMARSMQKCVNTWTRMIHNLLVCFKLKCKSFTKLQLVGRICTRPAHRCLAHFLLHYKLVYAVLAHCLLVNLMLATLNTVNIT